MTSMNKEILRMEEIESYYGGERILNGARLNLFQDEIIGVTGVNYSGKSALAGGIAGFYPYANGRTFLEEHEIKILSIEQARNVGIFYIQKKSSLIEDFTVLENLFLNVGARSILIQKKQIHLQCLEIMELLGIQAEISEKVETLSFKNRILVEIAKAIVYNVKILILDDVLNGMSKDALQWLAGIFLMLKSLHIGIILIDNSFSYLKPFCQRLFIMRDGKTVAVLSEQEMKEDNIISYMIGRPMETREEVIRETVTEKKNQETLLQFQNIYDCGILHGLSFQVERDTITGILNMNKHSGEALEALFLGCAVPQSGSIFLEGKEIFLESAEQALKLRIAVVPEYDRIFDELSIEENIMMSAYKKNSSFLGRLDDNEMKYLTGELFTDFIMNVYPSCEADELVPENRLIRKKVSICRAVSTAPELIVLVNPTRSLGEVFRNQIYEDMMLMKKKKISLLLISSDVKELLQVCDKIIVVNQGKAGSVFYVTDQNREELFQMYGESLKNLQ